jgi:drug/metabolite transporter (DMT)-like permease
MKRPYSLGIFFKISSLIMFSIYSLLLMELALCYSTAQSLWLRSTISSLILLFLLLLKDIDIKINLKDFGLYALRAIFNCVGMASWIYAMREIGANEATAISYITPIFATLLSIILCGEKLNTKCILTTVVSMIGMYIIIQPNLAVNLIGISAALFSSLTLACYDIVCKKQTISEHYLKQAFYNFLFATILLSPFAWQAWISIQFDYNLIITILISTMSTLTIITLFLSYKYAPLVLLMPFQYLRLVFMAIASYFLYNQRLNIESVYGVVIIIIASTALFYHHYTGKISDSSLKN